MTITQARQALADLLSTIPYAGGTLRVRPQQIPTPQAGDGWVTAGPVRAAGRFGAHLLTLTGFVVVGSDPARADALGDELALHIFDAVADSNLAVRVGDVVVERQAVTLDGSGSLLFVLAITVPLEV